MAKPQVEASRFLFDNSFDAPKKTAKKAKPEDEKPPEPTFSRQQLEEARQQGYEQGRAAGAADAAKAVEAEVGRLVVEIAGRLPAMDAAQAAATERLMRDGAAVAAEIMRKILPSLVARNGLDEIDALLRQCLCTLIDQPKIVVRVSARHAAEISTRLAAAASSGRFGGRFMVEADDDMGPSDCQVSWQGGGLERNAEEIRRQVDDAVTRYLAVPAAAGGGVVGSPPGMAETAGGTAAAGAGPDAKDLPGDALDTTEER